MISKWLRLLAEAPATSLRRHLLHRLMQQFILQGPVRDIHSFGLAAVNTNTVLPAAHSCRPFIHSILHLGEAATRLLAEPSWGTSRVSPNITFLDGHPKQTTHTDCILPLAWETPKRHRAQTSPSTAYDCQNVSTQAS